ncbi:helix-turn-helix domain-containing protein [Hymenobacter properus]|uniref:Helix-turn-helix domain-containing protein n=1 Tax=Hymenobacter properus TaxID=2791026 RepID=A0A931BL45_9BACT|nr:AraC family transcriptional regulator [Hymenobacter properus]MBF9144302.1 helix-turn-helix domain-containing protein [Hymenobacter properus]MBR7723120.1 helix-turn-helix domain-containing protein [Microvirga sp. SRT04]
MRTTAPLEPKSLAAFYEACAPTPESAVGVLPPPDLGPGGGHFNVFPLEDLRGAPPMNFSRKDYYKITLCHGRSQVEYADQAPHVGTNTLFLVTPRVTYRWLPLAEAPAGYCCLFDDAFLLPARTGVVLSELPIFQPGAYPVWEVTEADCAALEAIFEKMARELPSAYAYKPDLLCTYLWELIYLVQKLQLVRVPLAKHSAAERVASQFEELLERQFPRRSPQPPLRLRTATDYAQQLAVHVNHLNRVLKETTGHTTTALISRRLVQEARLLLKQSTWSVSEVADSLGFADVAHFCTFFKRHAGHTPGDFRRLAG